EEPADTTVERRDHGAAIVVSALRRCVDACGKLGFALNALARDPRERSLRVQRLLAWCDELARSSLARWHSVVRPLVRSAMRWNHTMMSDIRCCRVRWCERTSRGRWSLS